MSQLSNLEAEIGRFHKTRAEVEARIRSIEGYADILRVNGETETDVARRRLEMLRGAEGYCKKWEVDLFKRLGQG